MTGFFARSKSFRSRARPDHSPSPHHLPGSRTTSRSRRPRDSVALLKGNASLRRRKSKRSAGVQDSYSTVAEAEPFPGTDKLRAEHDGSRQSPDKYSMIKFNHAEAGKPQQGNDQGMEKRLNSFDTGDSAAMMQRDSHFFFGGLEKAVPTSPSSKPSSSVNGSVRRNLDDDDNAGAATGRRKILGGLFSKRPTPVSSSSTIERTEELSFTPTQQNHHRETKIYADPPPFARKQSSGGLFRSRSRLNASTRTNKPNVKRAHTTPISTADISSPLPVVLGDKYKPHPRQNMGSPKLNVDIPKVTMERYSVMFGTLLQRDISPPETLSEESICDKAREMGHSSQLNPQVAVPDESPVLGPFSFEEKPRSASPISGPASPSVPTLPTAQGPLSSSPLSRKREMPSRPSRLHRHKRSLTASDILSTKPQDSSHVVVMVETPSERAKSVILNSPKSPTTPHTPPSLPDSPLFASSPSLGDAMAQEEALKAAAEVSIARQISISRQQLLLPVVPRSERLVRRMPMPLTPTLVEMDRIGSRRSQRVQLECA